MLYVYFTLLVGGILYFLIRLKSEQISWNLIIASLWKCWHCLRWEDRCQVCYLGDERNTWGFFELLILIFHHFTSGNDDYDKAYERLRQTLWISSSLFLLSTLYNFNIIVFASYCTRTSHIYDRICYHSH